MKFTHTKTGRPQNHILLSHVPRTRPRPARVFRSDRLERLHDRQRRNKWRFRAKQCSCGHRQLSPSLVWPPLFGRLLIPEDANLRAGSTSQVAVISYEFSQRRCGGASDALGKQMRIEGRPFTIVGVTRKWFTGLTPGEPPDVTIPITAYPFQGRDGALPLD